MTSKSYSSTDFFHLFSSCILSKGYAKSAIHDVDRGKTYSISNEFYSFLAPNNGFLIQELVSALGPDHEEVLGFLLSKSLGFIADASKSELFPRMSLEYLNPFKITNMIIDIGEDLTHLESFLKDDSLEIIPTIQIRIFNKGISFNEVYTYLIEIEKKEIISVQLFIPITVFQNDEEFLLLNNLTKVDVLFVYGAKDKKNIPDINYKLIFLSAELSSHKSCGKISLDQFSVNIKTYAEAQEFNTCLNCKISIDIDGKIKNCPSMAKDFGNIKDNKLADVLDKVEFKKHWKIGKDQIKVCKDCEFRYVCTDCRAFIEVPDDVYSKPLKCGYDPYRGEWEEWSNNSLKQHAIEFYAL